MRRAIPALCALGLVVSGCQTSSTEAASTQASATSTTPPACAQEHNPLWGVRPLPLRSDPSLTFDFTIESDQYDACTPLSWSVISGMAGGSFRKAVTFYDYGALMTEPDPLLLGSLDGVQRIDPQTVQINYRGQEHARFRLEGSTLQLVENTLAPDAVFSAPYLSLDQFKD